MSFSDQDHARFNKWAAMTERNPVLWRTVQALGNRINKNTMNKARQFISEYQTRKTVAPPPPAMKKGGKIKKTGVYLLHKNEVVVPANRVKSVDKSLKKDNKKPLKK